jgi:hypothetical protein
MNAPEPSRRRRFDLPAIVAILAFVATLACFATWKWSESSSRSQILGALRDRDAVAAYGARIDAWSSEWPFHNAERATEIQLHDGRFNDEDIRRLRWAFPGVPIYHTPLEYAGRYYDVGPADIVKLPED